MALVGQPEEPVGREEREARVERAPEERLEVRGPCQPSFCSSEYIHHDGITDVVIGRKNRSAIENSTAFVHDHSKSRRNVST